MAAKTDSKIPQIRFKGFEGEWEEKAFLEVTTKIGSGKTPRGGDSSYVATGVPLLRSQNITNNSVNLNKVAFITEETDLEMANSRVKENDVLLNITGASIGRSAVYRYSNFANVNQHVCIIRPTENYCSSFFQLHLASTKGQKKIDNNQAGGAREGLNFQQIGGMSFDYPSFEEQNQIGWYFKELDGMIGLHQRKHGKLVTLKQAMLQKMFPQNGATTPEIRFKGFSEPWVEKTLGDLFPIKSAARVHKNEWTESGVPFFRSSDVVSAFKGKINTEAFISCELYEELSAKVGRIKKGDMLVTGGGSIGVPYLVPSDDPLYFKDADLLWFKIRESVDSYFLYTFFSSAPFGRYVKSISHIGTIAHYTVEQAKVTPLVAPSEMAEQAKIGTYFRQLDTLISKHATQLEKLKQLKSACLEKMFV
jgi:type I restriction enzyme S subunit